MSPQRNRLRDTDLAELLPNDRVFIAAQVTLLIKLMLTVLILDPRSVDTFSLPKSVAAHGTSLVLAALLVWLLARYGRRLLVWSPAHVAAAALLLAFAIATPFAMDPTVALFGVYRRYLGLTQMLDNVLLYVAVGLLFRDLRSLRLLAFVVFGTAIPVFLYAFVQRLGLDPLKFNVSTIIPITTIGNPDIAGAYMAMIGISALGVAFLLAGRLPRAYLVALSAIGVGSVAGSYLTGVRGGLLALAFGAAAVVLLHFAMPRSPGARWRIGVIAFSAVLAVAVVLSPVGARLNVTRLGSDPGVLSRFEVWEVAGKAMAARPAFGIGPDNLVAFYPANRTERSAVISGGELQNSTHDVWLYVATSSGLIGLAAFVMLVALLIERALRMARRGELGSLALIPLLAYLGQSLVGVNEVVVDWVFWLSAGIIAVTGVEAVRRPRVGWAAPQDARLVGGLALAAAIVVIVVTLPPRIAAGEALLASDAFAAANRGQEAVAHGQAAVAADARRAETWSSYGTALTGAASLTAAVAAFETAASKQPWEPLNWKNLAIVWSQVGNRGAAMASAERAVRADQYDADAHDIVATLAYDTGDYARAAAEGDRAIALRSTPQVSTYFTTASAYVQLKDLARAEAVLRAGIALIPAYVLRLQLAAILADRGDKAGALTLVDGVLAEDPANADAKTLRQALIGN
jgi:O-antigen ligase